MKNRMVTAAFAAVFLLASHGASLGAANVPANVTAAIADSHRPKSDTDRDADRRRHQAR